MTDLIIPSTAVVIADVSARVRRTAVQLIPNDANTVITWQAEDYDTDNFWVPGTPTILTIPLAGKYQLVSGQNWDVGAIGFRRGFFRLNGVTTLGITTLQTVSAVGVGTTFPVIEERVFAAGDTLELLVRHNQGAALNWSNNATFFAIRRIPGS